MSNPKCESISSGSYYFATLFKRLFRLHIVNDESKTEREREYLLLKLEEEKAWPGSKTKIEIFNELISQEGLSALDEELHYGKKQRDLNWKVTNLKSNRLKSKQSLGSYFYVAAIIKMLDYVVNEIDDLKEKQRIVNGLQPLTIKAAKYSRELKIVPPRMNDKNISNDKALKQLVSAWFLALNEKAQDERNEDYSTRVKLVVRGLLKGIPHIGYAIDALLFGRPE